MIFTLLYSYIYIQYEKKKIFTNLFKKIKFITRQNGTTQVVLFECDKVK